MMKIEIRINISILSELNLSDESEYSEREDMEHV